MKRKIHSTLSIGNTKKKNKKIERYINYLVLLGFGFMLFWIIFLYPRVFIDIKLVLSILLIPALVITLFLSNKIISALGYQVKIKNNKNYNFLIQLLTYILIMVPIGNFLVATFLGINTLLKEDKTETVYIIPQNISESYNRKSHDTYSHLEAKFDGVSKKINFGKTPINEMNNKKLKIVVSKGFFGYYVIRERRLI